LSFHSAEVWLAKTYLFCELPGLFCVLLRGLGCSGLVRFLKSACLAAAQSYTSISLRLLLVAQSCKVGELEGALEILPGFFHDETSVFINRIGGTLIFSCWGRVCVCHVCRGRKYAQGVVVPN